MLETIPLVLLVGFASISFLVSIAFVLFLGIFMPNVLLRKPILLLLPLIVLILTTTVSVAVLVVSGGTLAWVVIACIIIFASVLAYGLWFTSSVILEMGLWIMVAPEFREAAVRPLNEAHRATTQIEREIVRILFHIK